MRFAAIDVGSNAVRLLLSRVDITGVSPVFESISMMRMPIRLGDDAFVHGHISEEKVDQLVKTMIAFRYLLDAYEPIDFMACATSALREAQNTDDIVRRIKNETGIELDVISGRKEARIIYSNHVEKIIANDTSSIYLHIDVGGGSTELILFDRSKVLAYRSFNIGAIRMIEGLVPKEEWNNMKKWVKSVTGEYSPGSSVGSGGNINKVFSLANAKEGTPLSYDDIKKVYDHLKAHTLEERVVKLGLKPDRADVIIPASKIYLSVMRWGNVEKIYVLQLGLADGIIHVLYERHKDHYV
ncbi:MAG: exopolyphosphatase [Methanolobus sp.]|uniref:Ppx/GppA phosphatase family protein n=1 Tax=Methanolobus sp. TaxID=1874737 RepID=UPI00272FC1EC|nr:exopolyphosphatase [Methanolobus sp.]MDP2216319.1 exopolyphosphatase [Methanolobus sp.]